MQKIVINKDNDLMFRTGLPDQKKKKSSDDETINESSNSEEKIEYFTEQSGIPG